jgi:hypothetical protein
LVLPCRRNVYPGRGIPNPGLKRGHQTRTALPDEAAEDPLDDLATAAEEARASDDGGGNANNDQPAAMDVVGHAAYVWRV